MGGHGAQLRAHVIAREWADEGGTPIRGEGAARGCGPATPPPRLSSSWHGGSGGRETEERRAKY